MPTDRVMRFETTTDWQRIGALVDADEFLSGYSKSWKNVFAVQPADGAHPVLFAVTTMTHEPTNDAPAVLVVTTGSSFSEINFDDVWVRSPDGASVIEFTGALV